MKCQIDNCTAKHYGRGYCKKHHQRAWIRGLLTPFIRPSFVERLEDSIARIPESGCWIWLKSVNNHGYAHISVGGKSVFAHRASYEHFKGPIGPGLSVCHKCDIPSCVNPEHLFLGTHQENMNDSALKGRAKQPAPRLGFSHHAAAFTPAQVEYIRTCVEPAKSIAMRLGVNAQTIYRCRNGETYVNTSLRAPTKAERERINKMKQFGCVACAHLGVPNINELELHHILQGNKRMGHWFSVFLCRSHHRGFYPKDHLWMSDEDRVSIADGRKAFTRIYPSERELWEKVQDRLHEPKSWPESKRVKRDAHIR